MKKHKPLSFKKAMIKTALAAVATISAAGIVIIILNSDRPQHKKLVDNSTAPTYNTIYTKTETKIEHPPAND